MKILYWKATSIVLFSMWVITFIGTDTWLKLWLDTKNHLIAPYQLHMAITIVASIYIRSQSSMIYRKGIFCSTLYFRGSSLCRKYCINSVMLPKRRDWNSTGITILTSHGMSLCYVIRCEMHSAKFVMILTDSPDASNNCNYQLPLHDPHL